MITSLTLMIGIDIHQLNMVINYDMTASWNNYIMQIGRAGRFGRKGVAISLMTADDAAQYAGQTKFFMEELPADIQTHINGYL